MIPAWLTPQNASFGLDLVFVLGIWANHRREKLLKRNITEGRELQKRLQRMTDHSLQSHVFSAVMTPYMHMPVGSVGAVKQEIARSVESVLVATRLRHGLPEQLDDELLAMVKRETNRFVNQALREPVEVTPCPSPQSPSPTNSLQRSPPSTDG